MQAITTRHLPPTALKPARIKAKCLAGSLTITYPTSLEPEQAHQYAAELLMVARQWKGYRLHTGQQHTGDYVHVLQRVSE